MSSSADDILGVLYIEPEQFLSRAKFFGAGTSCEGLTADDVKPLIAMGSRLIDAEVGRSFKPTALTELHKLDLRTLRVSVNQPPVITLQSFKLITAPGQGFEFDVAGVLVNNQENYLELATPVGGEGIISEMITSGVREPQIEVTYLSYQSIPEEVITACGFASADLAAKSQAAQILPPGLTMEKVEGATEVRRSAKEGTSGEAQTLPLMAKLLLSGLKRIAVG